MITKINDELNEDFNNIIDESIQIGDKVMLDQQRGYVVGQTNDGDLLVQIQYSVKKVNPSKVKGEKDEAEVKPPMKFDKVSQKLLFEQYVHCGIFMDRTPIKVSNCYVKYSDFNNAKNEDFVSVIIEGEIRDMSKNNIKILEDVNIFGNPDNYVQGYIINEETEEIIETVMVNSADYINAIGDAVPIRIVRLHGETIDDQTFTSISKSSILIEQK